MILELQIWQFNGNYIITQCYIPSKQITMGYWFTFSSEKHILVYYNFKQREFITLEKVKMIRLTQV